MDIRNYLQDGAGAAARGVLCILQGLIGDGLECSWNKDFKRYEAEIKIVVWIEGRQKGYCVYLRNPEKEQMNIAFYEQCNSDAITAIKWWQGTSYPPNPDNANQKEMTGFGTNYILKTVSYKSHYEMADWIFTELNRHWVKNQI